MNMDDSLPVDPLVNIIECRRDIERNLKSIARPRDSRRKRHRAHITATVKKKDFEKNMLKVKKKIVISLKALFAKYDDFAVYNRVAYDLMRIFYKFEERYDISSDDLYYALRCLVIPVCGEILDEVRVGKRAHEKQQLRKYFFDRLINFELFNHETNVADSGNDQSPVDNVSERSETTRYQSTNATYEKSLLTLSPSGIILEILDVLFEAIGKQIVMINDSSVELCNIMHHIINITYIVELLQEYLDLIKIRLEQEIRCDALRGINTLGLYRAVDKYEKDLIGYLEEFDSDSPLTIFRDQLDMLLFRLITIKPVLNRR